MQQYLKQPRQFPPLALGHGLTAKHEILQRCETNRRGARMRSDRRLLCMQCGPALGPALLAVDGQPLDGALPAEWPTAGVIFRFATEVFKAIAGDESGVVSELDLEDFINQNGPRRRYRYKHSFGKRHRLAEVGP